MTETILGLRPWQPGDRGVIEMVQLTRFTPTEHEVSPIAVPCVVRSVSPSGHLLHVAYTDPVTGEERLWACERGRVRRP